MVRFPSKPTNARGGKMKAEDVMEGLLFGLVLLAWMASLLLGL